MRLNNRGNWSLIGILAAVAIVVVIAAICFTGGNMTTVNDESPLLDAASDKETVVGKAMDTAKAEECRSRLNQIRTAITMYKDSEASENNPAALKDLRMGVSADYFQCPISQQPFKYDPSTGQVQCLYSGHENY